LLEVLISLFVMAIGMLALLTLFPLGAISMAQALQHDRAASAANLAAEYAEAMDLRHDPNVVDHFTIVPPGYPDLPNQRSGPSWPVFVDGFGALVNPNPVGAAPPITPGIVRVRPSYATTWSLAARWFSLLDDLSFDPSARPANGLVSRGGRYTWAYLLRRPRAFCDEVVDLTVVVYAGRDIQLGGGETPYPAAGAKGTNNVVLSYLPPLDKPALRRNAWILDVTYDATNLVTRGEFYRVVNVAELSSTQLSLEVEGLLQADVNTVVVLDNAIEVMKKGSGWSP
jgi:hypothetical protein